MSAVKDATSDVFYIFYIFYDMFYILASSTGLHSQVLSWNIDWKYDLPIYSSVILNYFRLTYNFRLT